jgi:hypothetical protein
MYSFAVPMDVIASAAKQSPTIINHQSSIIIYHFLAVAASSAAWGWQHSMSLRAQRSNLNLSQIEYAAHIADPSTELPVIITRISQVNRDK